MLCMGQVLFHCETASLGGRCSLFFPSLYWWKSQNDWLLARGFVSWSCRSRVWNRAVCFQWTCFHSYDTWHKHLIPYRVQRLIPSHYYIELIPHIWILVYHNVGSSTLNCALFSYFFNILEKTDAWSNSCGSEVLSWTKIKAFSPIITLSTQVESFSLVHRSAFLDPVHPTHLAMGERHFPSSAARFGSSHHFTCEAVIKNLLVLL